MTTFIGTLALLGPRTSATLNTSQAVSVPQRHNITITELHFTSIVASHEERTVRLMPTAELRGGEDATSVSAAPSSSAGPPSQSRTSRRMIPPTKEQAIRIVSGNVNQLSKAKAHLTTKGFITQGDSITLLGMSLILFQIAAEAKTPATADNIKAVAFLIETLGVDSITDRIMGSMDAKFTRIFDSLDATVANLESREEEIGETATTISNAVLQLIEVTNDSTKSLEDAADRVCNQVDRQTKVQEQYSDRQPNGDTPQPQQSYAAVTARTHVPLIHAGAVAKQDERARQIVIQPNVDSLESFRSLTELELVAKATLAFDAIEQGDNAAPPDLRFVGAKKLAAGTVILDLNSTKAANWIKTPVIRPRFMLQFSARSMFKDHEYRVLAEFVPVTFSFDALAALERVEKDSGATPGSLVRAEWAKLPGRRHTLQHTAHLKLFFSSPEAANYAIRNGIYIEGKKVNVRKMQQEARRCAKCQRYGHGNNEGEPHFAKDCKWVHDTCGGCGQQHCREECMANLTTDSFCINCNEKGHTVWDRNCPVFIDRCKSLNASRKESGYTLFVTWDSMTWEMLEREPKWQADEEDGWSQMKKRGSSGRGGIRDHHRTTNPDSGTRGRTQTNDTIPPTTSTNRTELGPKLRCRQLTFEETAEKHRNRPRSQEPPVDHGDHPDVPMPRYNWNSAPHHAPEYRSWFEETGESIHMRRPRSAWAPPSTSRQPSSYPSTQC